MQFKTKRFKKANLFSSANPPELEDWQSCHEENLVNL